MTNVLNKVQISSFNSYMCDQDTERNVFEFSEVPD